MKRITSILLVILSLTLIIPMAIIGTSASSAYQTYTYDVDGFSLYSPDAYSAEKTVDYLAMNMTKNFSSPSDIVTDSEEKIYIADTGNNRIVVLNRFAEYDFEISEFINGAGNNDVLSGPKGVFVTDESIWVCDTGKNRLVEFDKEGNFKQIIGQPESQLFGENATYTPISMAVDQYGRIYVASSTTTDGLIVMDASGEFVGFIGAQPITISAWEIIWRNIQTEEQKLTSMYEAANYNSVAITEEGFIYATTSSIDESTVKSAITGRKKEGKNMPVKLLNPSGDEIMRRNGFWPPAGEVALNNIMSDNENAGRPSVIGDVAVGPEKTWSIIDTLRNKIYIYDFNGNLLFAFGDSGTMLGSVSKITSIAYQNDRILILDAQNNNIVVYERTEYGDLLLDAIAAENDLDFAYAIECWEKVLQRNTNFDAAYVGIGNAYYRSANYEEALAYYEAAYDTSNWSESFQMVRKEWMSDWFLVIVIVIIALCILLGKFFGWAAKVNKRVATDGKARKTFGQELLYGFYVIFHPFDGFYDLKHEHRGSVRAALVFLAATIVAFYYQSIGQGYVMNPYKTTGSIFIQLISVLLPLLLFVIGNWCLTTLFEGEGSFKDIFVATCYSLLPVVLLVIPATILSNFVTSTEASLVSMITVIAFIWVGLLLFSGTMITHDYSIFKNLITIIGTVVAMACIVFVVLLFSMLLSKLVGLVTNIVTEIQYRF